VRAVVSCAEALAGEGLQAERFAGIGSPKAVCFERSREAPRAGGGAAFLDFARNEREFAVSLVFPGLRGFELRLAAGAAFLDFARNERMFAGLAGFPGL
jgi:hypothetical protein